APRRVTAEEFAKVNEWGARTEAGIGSVVSKLVRGGGPLALNNEALAGLIETSVSVSALKGAEKVAWCFYLATNPKPKGPLPPKSLYEEAVRELAGAADEGPEVVRSMTTHLTLR